MTTQTANRTEILGWTDEVLDCDVCGRLLDRERTLAYRTDAGDVEYAGTSCAASVLGTTAPKVRAAANRIEREAREAERAAEQALENERHARRLEAEIEYLSELTGRKVTRGHAWGPNGYGTAKDEVMAAIRKESGYRGVKAFSDEVERRAGLR